MGGRQLTMSILEQTELAIAGRLAADSYFAQIPIVVMRPRASGTFAEIQSRIDAALNGTLAQAGGVGAAVTVLMPIGDCEKPNLPGPQLTFVYTVRVQELVQLNMSPAGTRKSAEEIALYALGLLHQCSLNGRQVLTAEAHTLTPSLDFAPRLTYDLRLRQLGALPQPVRCAAPVIALSGDTATLTCATAGAAIYYTTDGSYPSPANGTLYSAPVTAASGLTMLAAASHSGVQQSAVAAALFP